MPQSVRHAEMIELVFELFSGFEQMTAIVARIDNSKHQVTNRTKMNRGDE